MANPEVSVLIVTYNHEPYIRQAAESALRQDAPFRIEILISEDCSTDRTREVVLALQREHPDQIRTFLSPRNQNNNEVFTRVWEAAAGRFIAILDGDDYWTDPEKLRKQVAFLESHPDIFVCGHAVRQVDGTGRIVNQSKFDIYDDRLVGQLEMALGFGYVVPTLSMVFRNNGRIPRRDVFDRVFNTDTFMCTYFANFGGAFISREAMGVHRIHAGGVWANLDDRASIDHRNFTLSHVPEVIDPPLRAIAYLGFLRHSLFEDDRWTRKLKTIPITLVRILWWLRPTSARFVAAGLAHDLALVRRRLIGRIRSALRRALGRPSGALTPRT